MHQQIRKWIEYILMDNMDLLWISVRQRAKFEGWLKFELARYIMNNVDICVRVEKYFQEGNNHIDIVFNIDNKKYFLELKTPNASYKIEEENINDSNHIINVIRPITDNIDSIIKDANKLREIINNLEYEAKGFCAFVMFPIPLEENREELWRQHINRIGEELEINLAENEYWERVHVIYENHRKCDVIVCCFPINQML